MSVYISVDRYGDKILTREKTVGDKFAKFYTTKYSPTLYVPENDPQSKWRSLMTQKPLGVRSFESIKEANNFIKKYKAMGLDIHGMDNWVFQFISDQWEDEISEVPNINVGFFDMETTSDNGFPNVRDPNDSITALCIHSNGHYYAVGLGDFIVPKKWKALCTYFKCTDEAALIRTFISIIKSQGIDVLAGWNSEAFDIPYLIGRGSRVLGETEMLTLSPFKLIQEKNFRDERGKEILTYHIYGLPHVDYQQIYAKYSGKTQESYALDHISKVELNKGKLDYSEWGTIQDIHLKNHQIFIEYNIEDVMRLVEIDEKRKLMGLVFNLAYTAKVNFSDVLRQTRMWDSLIYSGAKKEGMIIPLIKSGEKKSEKYRGAYVMDPIPGSYDWLVSFDLNSLYPNLMIQYNISPETLVADRVNEDLNSAIDRNFIDPFNGKYSIAANGACFTKKFQGILPKILLNLMKEREHYKGLQLKTESEINDLENKIKAGDDSNDSKMELKELKVLRTRYKNLQETKKVCLNSAYGALGTSGFRFFSVELAEAITISGQLTIRWITNGINSLLDDVLGSVGNSYVVAGDTDSIYVNLNPVVKHNGLAGENPIKIAEFLDKFANEKISPFFDKSYSELAEQQSAYVERMKMKRESIIERAVWHAKKNYIMALRNGEGGIMYQEPVIKMKGISAVKSSTPEIVRNSLKAAMKIILMGTKKELETHIENTKRDFFKRDFLSIAKPNKVTDMEKFYSKTNIYVKSTPMHIRAALLYNHFLKKNGLDNKYRLIRSGDKIKYCMMQSPNYFNSENVMAVLNEVPEEMNISDYVDYDGQFVLLFLKAVHDMAYHVGWIFTNSYSMEELL